MHPIKKKQIIKEALVASLVLILIDFLLSFIPLKFEFMGPIRQEFSDFDVYDLRFSGEDSLVNKMDTTITVLEIGRSREEIAAQIRFVASCNPEIIGVDAIFNEPVTAGGDSLLIAAIRGAKNIVFASKYNSGETRGHEFIQHSFFAPQIHGLQEGYFNLLEGPEQVKRHFLPFLHIDGLPYPALTTRMLNNLNKSRYQELEHRDNPTEAINYSGNQMHFNVVSLEKFLAKSDTAGMKDLFDNKIVFIGFIKDSKPDVLEDLHFTPMNHKHNGKSFPDMYGVLIHANILSMMLNSRYIREMSSLGGYLLSFLFIFGINIFYLLRLAKGRKHNHFMLFMLQIALAIIATYIALLIFDWFNYKIDLLPLMVAIVLSLEVFWLYELFAVNLKKWFGYETYVHS